MSSSLAPAGGILGLFFVMLGVGLVLDADWTWRGGSAIAFGGYLLLVGRQALGGEP